MKIRREKVWYLKRFPLFEGLKDEQVQNLAQFLDHREVGRMQVIFEPEDEDKAFFVKRGMVEVYQLTEEGKKVILETLGQGSFFGAIGAGAMQQYFLEATEDTILCVATRQRLVKMMTQEPSVAAQLIDDLFEQLFEAREQIAMMASGNVRERLIWLFKLLAKKYGEEKGRFVKVASRFTHESMADMIGASRETVTKTLKVLEKEGVIQRKGRMYRVSKHLLK